jgi:hypothetical protein
MINYFEENQFYASKYPTAVSQLYELKDNLTKKLARPKRAYEDSASTRFDSILTGSTAFSINDMDDDYNSEDGVDEEQI